MNVFIKPVKPENAPKALGPYTPAVKLGDFVYLSGQIPLDPKSGEVVGTTIEEQTHQVMKNIQAVLNEIGLDFRHSCSGVILRGRELAELVIDFLDTGRGRLGAKILDFFHERLNLPGAFLASVA